MAFVDEKFEQKVIIAGADDCWIWTGGTCQGGYGVSWCPTRKKLLHATHRAFEWAAGRPVQARLIRHTCDNRPCVNPKHLIEGSHQDNMDDMRLRGRSPSSANGRHYSISNPEKVARGAQKPNTKLTPVMKEEILNLHSRGWSQSRIADRFEVCQQLICRLLKQHGVPTIRHRGTPGEHNAASKLNWDSVREIRRLRQEGSTLKALSERFNVTAACISYICRGVTWKEETITDG